MLEPIKGSYYRKFQPQSYNENDSKGKITITNYLESIGHTILDTKEDYSFDIKSEKNGCMYYSEVEMKNQWKGEWNPNWSDVRVPYRKHRLINKYEQVRNDKTFCNFYIIRNDRKQAWRVKDYQLTKECAKEVWLSNAGRYEYFFNIPYQEAELVNLV